MSLSKLGCATLATTHMHLSLTDECYCIGYYAPDSPLRDIVLGLKRQSSWAVAKAAQVLRENVPSAWLASTTLVPMPSSRCAAHVMRSVTSSLGASDMRPLLRQTVDTPAAHLGWRAGPWLRIGLLEVRKDLCFPAPKTVLLVDDVLTTGAHFVAAKRVLRSTWPNVRVIGIFLARTPGRLWPIDVPNPVCTATLRSIPPIRHYGSGLRFGSDPEKAAAFHRIGRGPVWGKRG